ncbi:hypothetical protein BGZ67_003985 [Mortierella alpina]|nr:hypothetical protein BGZ67_003985 [Mortierella alpina]
MLAIPRSIRTSSGYGNTKSLIKRQMAGCRTGEKKNGTTITSVQRMLQTRLRIRLTRSSLEVARTGKSESTFLKDLQTAHRTWDMPDRTAAITTRTVESRSKGRRTGNKAMAGSSTGAAVVCRMTPEPGVILAGMALTIPGFGLPHILFRHSSNPIPGTRSTPQYRTILMPSTAIRSLYPKLDQPHPEDGSDALSSLWKKTAPLQEPYFRTRHTIASQHTLSTLGGVLFSLDEVPAEFSQDMYIAMRNRIFELEAKAVNYSPFSHSRKRSIDRSDPDDYSVRYGYEQAMAIHRAPRGAMVIQ